MLSHYLFCDIIDELGSSLTKFLYYFSAMKLNAFTDIKQGLNTSKNRLLRNCNLI